VKLLGQSAQYGRRLARYMAVGFTGEKG
jgi:hypothetical protein